MRFNQLLRELRQRKKRLDSRAYTQEACGSRMKPEPITQSAWSQLEAESSEQPEYNTVLRAAEALNSTDKEKQALLEAAGYDVRKQFRILEATEYRDGEEKPIELTPETRETLRQIQEDAKRLFEKIDKLLPC